MAVLTAKTRAKIPTAKFALAGRRFPVHDKVHARVAKSYASRMVKRGQLSSAAAAKVNAAANRTLGRSGVAEGGLAGGGKMQCMACGGKKMGKGGRCMACGGRMKSMMGGGRMRLALGGLANFGKKAGAFFTKTPARSLGTGATLGMAGSGMTGSSKSPRKKMQMGGPSVNDSGRTKKRMRLKYATGGAVAAVEFEGVKGQKRLTGNANYGGFARFDGDGGAD